MLSSRKCENIRQKNYFKILSLLVASPQPSRKVMKKAFNYPKTFINLPWKVKPHQTGNFRDLKLQTTKTLLLYIKVLSHVNVLLTFLYKDFAYFSSYKFYICIDFYVTFLLFQCGLTHYFHKKYQAEHFFHLCYYLKNLAIF